jgi:hypothetical protein
MPINIVAHQIKGTIVKFSRQEKIDLPIRDVQISII